MNGALCIDASVAVKWLFPEADSERALALLSEAIDSGTRLIAPPNMPVEVASAIHKRRRTGEVSRNQAIALLKAFDAMPTEALFPDQLSIHALDIASRFDHAYPYDAFYLALAEMNDCELWTADAAFHREASVAYARVRLISEYGQGQR